MEIMQKTSHVSKIKKCISERLSFSAETRQPAHSATRLFSLHSDKVRAGHLTRWRLTANAGLFTITSSDLWPESKNKVQPNVIMAATEQLQQKMSESNQEVYFYKEVNVCHLCLVCEKFTLNFIVQEVIFVIMPLCGFSVSRKKHQIKSAHYESRVLFNFCFCISMYWQKIAAVKWASSLSIYHPYELQFFSGSWRSAGAYPSCLYIKLHFTN